MSFKIIIISLLGLLLGTVKSRAQQNDVSVDSLQISLLTCGPGEVSYELFGHTALRVQNFKSGEDLVFNYGIFDFDTPNFALRFMLGETDYTIGATYFSSFAKSYERHGRYIIGQVLNLHPEEEAKLLTALKKDWATPDWTYRYNIIYDNCTTRAYEQIKHAVNGQLVLPKFENGRRTFRDILHEFTSEVSPWNSFANDLLLGSEVDQPIDVEKQMFSPMYAERFLDEAYVVDEKGERRSLVDSKSMVVQVVTDVYKPLFITPMIAVVLLLLVTIGLTVLEFYRKKRYLVFDYLLMTVQGVAGCIVAFLFFLSEHAAVDSNWLIILLNPLPLCVLPFKIWRDKKQTKDYYYRGVLIALLIFGGAILCHVQEFPREILIVALILLVRAVGTLCLEKLRK